MCHFTRQLLHRVRALKGANEGQTVLHTPVRLRLVFFSRVHFTTLPKMQNCQLK